MKTYKVLKQFITPLETDPEWATVSVWVEKLSPDDTIDIFDTNGKV